MRWRGGKARRPSTKMWSRRCCAHGAQRVLIARVPSPRHDAAADTPATCGRGTSRRGSTDANAIAVGTGACGVVGWHERMCDGFWVPVHMCTASRAGFTTPHMGGRAHMVMLNGFVRSASTFVITSKLKPTRTKYLHQAITGIANRDHVFLYCRLVCERSVKCDADGRLSCLNGRTRDESRRDSCASPCVCNPNRY